MKIALVHDYLREYGGAERVLESIHEIWPEAPLYTAFVDWGNLGNQGYRFKNWEIRTSWVQKWWLIKKLISPLRFLAPKIWSSFNLSNYDVVLTSSGWFICRGVKTGSALHVCYIHHPPRNLYGYPTGSTLQKYWLVRVYTAIINFFLRHYDFETAQKVDWFVANSKETARRVEKFYRRDSIVIYPPIEVIKKTQISEEKNYFLSVGRLVWSKRVDLAILAANKLKLPLKIVGTGPEEKYLRSIAGPTVEFLGSVDDEKLGNLYAGAKALIFCALEEDFGMVPVEAMAYGVPVIGLGQGGVLETVIDGKTGAIFNEPTVASLIKAINKFNKTYMVIMYNQECRMQAERFSKVKFKKALKKFVEDKYEQPRFRS